MAVAAVLILTGCDGREHLNPLDPLNDETGGRPDWLRAVADDRAVDLSWESAPPVGLVAYELYRAGPGQSFFRIARLESPFSTSFRDTGLANGVAVSYRLDLSLEGGRFVPLPAKTATPGAVVPWVLETASFGLVKCTPDARHVRLRSGSDGLLFDAATVRSGSEVWAADFYAGQAVHFDAQGDRLGDFSVEIPFRIAADPVRSIIWVGSWMLGVTPALIAFDEEGNRLAHYDFAGELRDVAVDTTSGACFVAGGTGRTLVRAARGETLVVHETADSLMMVAVDPGRRVWVGAPFSGRVIAFDPLTLTELVATDAVASPQAMTATPDGRLWVVDGAERLVCLDADANVVCSLGGRGSATSIGWDPEAEAIWLAQPGLNRVLRLLAADESVTVLPLFQPFHVALGVRVNPAGRSSMPRELARAGH
jgi:hypothetical protein